jgi:hypothetical protein
MVGHLVRRIRIHHGRVPDQELRTAAPP